MDRIKCEIRPASEDLHGRLTLLAEETLHPLAIGAGHPERYHSRELIDLLRTADVYVAEGESEIVGFVALERDEDALAVRCVCVHPAFEARGVARRLLDWAEGLAIDRGLTRVTAYVPAADGPSLHLYRGHGFAVGEPAGDEMLRLEKRLPTADR